MAEELKNAEDDLLSAITSLASQNVGARKVIQEVSKMILENQNKSDTKSEYVESHLEDFRKLVPGDALKDLEKKIAKIIDLSKEFYVSQEDNFDLLNNLINLKPFLTIEEDVKFYENLHQKNEKVSEKMNVAQESLLKGMTSYVERFSKDDRRKLALYILLEQVESQFVQKHFEFIKNWIQL